jgi:tape measure domain-containing protein
MAYTVARGAVISVSVDGAAASQRQIDSIAQSMGNLASIAQNAVRSLAATAGIGGGLVQVVQLSDEYTKLTSQLRLATQSQSEYQAALGSTRRIAQDTQSDLAATGVLYARIANGTRELGIGQKAVADITEVVNLSLRVSAASAEESASAQLQLSQAFASGALRGEEFNAVNEAAPRLMKALADGIGVPVGALKQMASDGKITSEVMASVLPKALEQLRDEAKQVQTISGAFTTLKNSVLEFTATSAQSNGSVAVLTGGINLLADNLAALTGVLTTVTAVKAANWLQTWTVETYRKIAADQAGRAATLASAQADLARVEATGAQAVATQAAIVVAREEAMARLAQANANILAAQAAVEAATAAGAQSFALRTLRLATNELQAAEVARGAMLAELAVLGQQQVRVSAEITAARAAETTATAALNTAQAGASLTAGLATRALGLLGGPLGAVVTVLGLAATAWSVYGSKSDEANKQAATSVEQTTPEIIANLEKQNAKLRERLALMRQGMPELGKDNSPEADRLASTLTTINGLIATQNKLRSQGKDLDSGDQVMLITLQGLASELKAQIDSRKQVTATIEAEGSAATDLIAVRERLAGVDKQYFEDLAKLQTAREKGAIAEKEYVSLVSQLATETYKKSQSGKESVSAINKENEAYTGLITAVREKIDASVIEARGMKAVTESQKLQIALDDQLASKKLKLTPAHKAEYEALIKQLAANEAVIASQKKAAQGAEDFQKILKEYSDSWQKTIDDAEKEASTNEDLVRTFGLTKSAIEQMELARLEDQLAQRSSTALTLDEIENLEKLIAAKRRSVDALSSLEMMEANRKAFDQMAADAKRSSEQIEQALTDSIMRGGKNGAEYVEDLFRTLILKPTIQAAFAPVANALTGSTPSAGVGTNSLINAASSASNLYSAATGGLFNAGGTAIAGIGNLVGSSSLSAFGAGFAGNSAGMAMTAAEGFQAAGMAAEASAASLGASVAAALPYVGTAVAAFAILKKGFGHGATEVASQGLRGTLTADSVAGQAYQNKHQDGGWFTSDRNWTDTQSLSAELSKQLTQGLSSIEAATAGFAKSLGVQADWISTYSKSFDIALTGDQTKDAQAITDFFSGLSDEIATRLVPNLADFEKSGETLSATLQRLAGDFQSTDQVAQLIGKTAEQAFGAAGIESAKAREQLIDLAGGVSTLTSEAQSYAQNYLTDAQRLVPVQKALDAAMASLGLSSVQTRDQFKEVVDSLDLTTESGAREFSSLMALADAFAQVHPQVDAVAEAAKKAADEAAKAAAALQGVKDAASVLLGDVDNAYSALEKVAAREKDAVQASISVHTASVTKLQNLAQALSGTLTSIQSPDQKLMARTAGQAQIRAALAIARAGGPLPDADSLKDALSAVQQDATSKFGTYNDYLRDLYQTQNDIAALGDLTDDQLSVEQKTLDALQDQLTSIDDLLSNAEQQIDILKGIDTNGLTLVEAMQALTSAIVNSKSNPIVGATASINQAYQQYLGRTPDAAGLEWWQNAAANGAPISQIVDGIAGSTEANLNKLYQSVLGRAPDAEGLAFWMNAYGSTMDAAETADFLKVAQGTDEYKKLHPFAVGTNFVPEDMPAFIHAGERIIPAADNRELMNRLASPSGNNDALLAEVKALRAEVQAFRIANSAENTSIAKSSAKSADALDGAVNGGRPLLTATEEG